MPMTNLAEVEKRVTEIEKRNGRVEADKAWETSWTRRGLLILFTYLSVGFYMQAIGISNPWLNAIIPSLGLLLSTLTLPFFKNLWISLRKKI
jgi:hypothetical protein